MTKTKIIRDITKNLIEQYQEELTQSKNDMITIDNLTDSVDTLNIIVEQLYNLEKRIYKRNGKNKND